jgi:chaperonin GroEL
MQIGSDLAREAANRCVQATGDGTTTATTLVQAMCHAGVNFIEAGTSPWELKLQMDSAAALIVEQLTLMAVPVTTPEETSAIAYIASNGDQALADIICEAFALVGVEGAVSVEESGTILTDLTITNGIEFISGEFLSASFANDLERFEAVYEDAFVLLYEGRIGTAKSIAPLLAQVSKTGKPLLVICGDIEQDGLACFVVNRIRAQAPIVVVKSGAYGERRKDLLRDIAAVTGGTAIMDDSGIKLESANLSHLGQTRRIVVTDSTTTVIDGYGTPESIASRVGEIKTKMETADGVNKAWLERRLAQLTTGIALIRVGGNTNAEMRERKDRFDDAAGAVRCAIQSGCVPGGGLALLKAQARVFSSNPGLTVVSQACVEPLKQIAKNAGEDPVMVLLKIIEHPFYMFPDPKYDWGYDARANEFTNLIERGILDPVKVVIEALKNATATAGTLLLTECLDVEPKEEIEAAIQRGSR